MPYTALPDRRMPYDNDGTRVGYVNAAYTSGIGGYLSGAILQEQQDEDLVAVANPAGIDGGVATMWHFFPEVREITAGFTSFTGTAPSIIGGTLSMWGSSDSTNGLDGTWETGSFPSGSPLQDFSQADKWRSAIKPISFTGGKRVLRSQVATGDISGTANWAWSIFHLHGEKSAGQTPDDLIYIDHDTTPGVEYATPEDFGDRPLGTSVVRQFRLKNVSATKTANTINIQCNDTDFAISTDGTTWVATINIASLAAGAESATLYVRNTTPAIGSLLGPRFARIVTLVGSWT